MGFSTLVLAAGAGTRMKSEKPKVAHEILAKPLIRWVVDTAKEAGSDEMYVVLGHGRETTVPLVPDCTIIYQDELLGTGHAVMMAQATLKKAGVKTLVVLSGDTPLLRSSTINTLVAEHQRSTAAVSLLTMKVEHSQGYGRIIRDANGAFISIVEDKDASALERAVDEVNTGVYCFDTDNLFKVLKKLNTHNKQGEYYLTDVPRLTLKAGGRVTATLAEDPHELAGINNRLQLAQAAREAQRRINTQHMLNGVSIVDPSTVWIGPDVELSHDVEILPLTNLSGKTTIAWGSVIGPMSRINNSSIGKSCVVDESVLINAVLKDKVSVGPRAYLRPGTVMYEGSRAGTHVEIKQSEVGPNSKIPHLSYIGDAVLGAEVNIGAGSITCNYDGDSKHRTIIGSRSFIGSDTMFVAPVEIGEDALTGAGSVITKDIPAGALGITRSKQVNHKNWKSETEEYHD